MKCCHAKQAHNITVIFTVTLDLKAVIIHHNSIHKGYVDHYSRSYNWNFRITPCVSNLHFCKHRHTDTQIPPNETESIKKTTPLHTHTHTHTNIYIWDRVKKTTPFIHQMKQSQENYSVYTTNISHHPSFKQYCLLGAKYIWVCAHCIIGTVDQLTSCSRTSNKCIMYFAVLCLSKRRSCRFSCVLLGSGARRMPNYTKMQTVPHFSLKS